MTNFIIGIGATVAFFSLIHISEKLQKDKKEDLTDEEKEWLGI